MKHSDRFLKIRLPLVLTLAAAVLLAGGITLLPLWCQPNALRSVLVIFKAQPLLIVLNALPVGLILLALTCLLRNVFFASSLTNLFVCGLSIAKATSSDPASIVHGNSVYDLIYQANYNGSNSEGMKFVKK